MVLLQAILKAWNWSSQPCRQQQPTLGVTPLKGQLPPSSVAESPDNSSPLCPSVLALAGGDRSITRSQANPTEPRLPLQLHSASLVVSPNNSNPTVTPFLSAMPRHYGQVSPTPTNCLFLMHFLNPFMVINRF